MAGLSSVDPTTRFALGSTEGRDATDQSIAVFYNGSSANIHAEPSTASQHPTMQVFHCDQFELPLPSNHRFPIEKYRLTRERVSRELGELIQLRVAEAASFEDLCLTHDREYLTRVFHGKLSDLEQRRIGFPWSSGMLERSRRSTGATIAAARAAIVDGIAVHLSGGTHHAFADHGQGFCVFNDVAVSAHLLLQARLASRILIIDLDVHQGNGTASIFAEDGRVFTFSMHGDRNYPFHKTNGDLDLALPDGTTDEDYLSALEQAFETQLPLGTSDFAFFVAGADPFLGDRMGRLKLTKTGLQRRDAFVISHLMARRIPLTVVMGGGYAAVNDVAEIHFNTVRTALMVART